GGGWTVVSVVSLPQRGRNEFSPGRAVADLQGRFRSVPLNRQASAVRAVRKSHGQRIGARSVDGEQIFPLGRVPYRHLRGAVCRRVLAPREAPAVVAERQRAEPATDLDAPQLLEGSVQHTDLATPGWLLSVGIAGANDHGNAAAVGICRHGFA